MSHNPHAVVYSAPPPAPIYGQPSYGSPAYNTYQQPVYTTTNHQPTQVHTTTYVDVDVGQNYVREEPVHYHTSQDYVTEVTYNEPVYHNSNDYDVGQGYVTETHYSGGNDGGYDGGNDGGYDGGNDGGYDGGHYSD